MEYKDFYKVLGVKATSSEDEIRQAYKKLAVKYHPDANPGDKKAEERFKEISEAKEVLLDPAHRQKYDELRIRYELFQQQQRSARSGNSFQTPPTGDAAWGGAFNNFWQEVFGSRRGPRRGRNYEANVKISLEEAYRGIQDILQFEGRRLRIKIKPGIENGQILNIKGQGAPGKEGGGPGDLYLKVLINPHPVYERKGIDLYSDLPVSLYSAVLGHKVEVNTLKGKKAVTIPAGSQHGDQLKLKGLGMPDYENPRKFGNLYLRVQVRIPRNLDEEEKKLFQQLDRIHQGKS